ncbi:PadR family transcriptional regulator [Solitalea sp. MAHUQ-68]|uniref:PadR family transcriptional regulator n=1 Tax=Solitalea agri TaxID=2953739 RepID=A0A9X2JAV3_9SPHI|nr:PadR family transcriptional regulator [Solitalea agri]MCO4291293.1 PadR family transcriptional regulator [Solitalea agri]
MIIENTQTQMRKGILEYCILSIISRGEIYASDIMEELRNARLLVVEGTLYPLLTRLKNNGLLVYNWVESASGPPRKYYKLSEDGLKVLGQLNVTWQELVYAVSAATSNHNGEKTIDQSSSDQESSEENNEQLNNQ